MQEETTETTEMSEGKLSHVRRGKYDRMMKHMMRMQTKEMSLKEKAKAERVNRGMEKIYALIDRGLNNVTSNG